MSLKEKIQSEKIAFMKSGEKFKRDTLTLVLSKIKQYEVDNKEDLSLNDTTVLSIIDKMIKERKDSIVLFEKASRLDLVEKESLEVVIISEFLPQQLTKEEIESIVNKAVALVNPVEMKDMGKVMAIVKPQIQGRGDMGFASSLVKKSIS